MLFPFLLVILPGFSPRAPDLFLTYRANPATEQIRLYWKNNKGELINGLGRLNAYLNSGGDSLLFGMNAGMFTTDYKPLGLYIENGKQLKGINLKNAEGNFYLKPNGAFLLLNNGKAMVCKSEEVPTIKNIKYATQSGPMLLINGDIHPAFTKGSSNLNIRNGVGILPDGKILFVLSKQAVNLYDFALYFKEQGCLNALYLDGYVSRAWYPAAGWKQNDEKFGVMIGVSKRK